MSDTTGRPRIVVVGGGISGTAAAWTAEAEARERRKDVSVVLLEASAELGGKAHSIMEEGWLFETGPLGYVNDVAAMDVLVDQVGLQDQSMGATDAQSHRFVFLDGKPREVRASPIGFLTSGLLTPSGLLRVAREPWIPKKKGDEDESVWDFAARRLGSEFADRLIHPMALGIFAGDAKRLSLPAAFPIMEELERDHGSLIRAQIARARARRRGELPPRRSRLCSFRDGLQSLPRALSTKGRFETRTSTKVTTVDRNGSHGWRVVVDVVNGGRDVIPADAVVLACEGWQSASLLASGAPLLSAALSRIAHPPVAVVALGYAAEAREAIPRGFGVLIPRDAGYRSLGVTCDGYLFPRREDEGLLIRVLLGGTFDPEIASLGTEELIAIAGEEVGRLFGFSAVPVFRRARLWPRAIPQYELGHREMRENVERELSGFPGLHLAGNALYGTSFGKAAARGVACGKAAVEALSSAEL